MRIASICPSNTELAGYLGLTHCLVGVDDYSDWPHSINSLPRLGPDLSINIDKLESLKPDLVLASLSVPGMEKNIEALKKRKIPYVVFQSNSLQEIGEDLGRLGELTGFKKQAREVQGAYFEIIERYRSLAAAVISRPTLYWEWWPNPIFTPGRMNWLTEISQLAGCENIFADVELASVQTDWKDVASRKPDHICMVWVGVEQKKMNPKHVQKRDGWEHLYKEKETSIHILEESLYCRPSPKLLIGLKKLANLIHPTLYPPNQQDELFLIANKEAQ